MWIHEWIFWTGTEHVQIDEPNYYRFYFPFMRPQKLDGHTMHFRVHSRVNAILQELYGLMYYVSKPKEYYDP